MSSTTFGDEPYFNLLPKVDMTIVKAYAMKYKVIFVPIMIYEIKK
ncbi:hypothetical protein [Lysinibacillus sp. fls2-241-R2A-57]|nr:hypothetical protein [Lysinibacillus sp. fls2-241-R2A-57]